MWANSTRHILYFLHIHVESISTVSIILSVIACKTRNCVYIFVYIFSLSRQIYVEKKKYVKLSHILKDLTESNDLGQ